MTVYVGFPLAIPALLAVNPAVVAVSPDPRFADPGTRSPILPAGPYRRHQLISQISSVSTIDSRIIVVMGK